jgi:hypothetical protein
MCSDFRACTPYPGDGRTLARTIAKLARYTTQRLKDDCEALLASDDGQTMDFLIKAAGTVSHIRVP